MAKIYRSDVYDLGHLTKWIKKKAFTFVNLLAKLLYLVTEHRMLFMPNHLNETFLFKDKFLAFIKLVVLNCSRQALNFY